LKDPPIPGEFEELGLGRWLRRALEKDPADRFPNAADAAQMLRGACDGLDEVSHSIVATLVEPMPQISIQVILTAEDREALTRYMSLDESGDDEEVLDDVSRIVSVGQMSDARWMQEIVLAVDRPPLPATTEVVEPAGARTDSRRTSMAIAGLLGVTLVFGVALQMSRSEESSGRDILSSDHVRIRVESNPTGARFAIDGAYSGTTPRVVERSVERFPFVLTFRHPNGAKLTKLVSEPIDRVAVDLPPPGTRPRSESFERELRTPGDFEEEAREKPSSASGTKASQEIADLVAPSDDINREIVLGPSGSGDDPVPGGFGAWYAEAQVRLTELARACMPPGRYPEDPTPDQPLLKPFVVGLRVRVATNGRVQSARVELVRDMAAPGLRRRRCIEEKVRDRFLPPPPRSRPVEEVIPLVL